MQFYKFQIHINYLDHEWLCATASLGYSKNRALLGVLLLYYQEVGNEPFWNKKKS